MKKRKQIKTNVACEDCRYLSVGWTCCHPSIETNDWYYGIVHRGEPSAINRNNDCELFERKIPAKPGLIRSILDCFD